MEKNTFTKEKVEKILRELGHRKEIKNAKIQLAVSGGPSSDEGLMGNVASCTDVTCGGGVGNVSACDDDVCSAPDSDPDCMGNTSACGDWVCDWRH